MPEDRGDPASPTIRLHVAIIASLSAHPQPDPIVYLEGGPGGSAILGIEDWVDSPYLGDREVILFDQRGTGLSEPSLNCEEMEQAYIQVSDDPAKTELAAVQACHDRLLNDGINLSAYTSAENAADLADLRVALGYPTWNVYGISYGTRLALTLMRDHPEGLRSVIIDSVYPPEVNAYEEEAANTQQAFSVLFDGCAAETACNAAYPNLKQTFYALIDTLNDTPAPVNTVDAASGQTVADQLAGDDVADIVFQAVYSTSYIAELPSAIYAASQGDYERLLTMRDGQYPRTRQTDPDLTDSEGMFNSVECAEEIPFNSLDKAKAAAAQIDASLQAWVLADLDITYATCAIWQVQSAPAIESQPVNSDVPTLVLAGEYDPITPPAWGQRAAANLSHSYFFTFPGMGHGVTFDDVCPQQISLSFLENPATQPDASCIKSMSPPNFVTDGSH
ncbi:MAG: alpha/beta hydrolase [Anaerolineae bacterium]|nr:alpha/beta hydrolase [Anaerolineae bacterium]